MPKKTSKIVRKSRPAMGTPEAQALITAPWSAEDMAGVLLDHVQGSSRKLPDDEAAGFFWRARKEGASILLETSHGAFVLEVRALPTEGAAS